jgi:hypothetical protein
MAASLSIRSCHAFVSWFQSLSSSFCSRLYCIILDSNPTAAIPIPSGRSVSFSRNRDNSGDSQPNSNPNSYQTRNYQDLIDGGLAGASSRSSEASSSFIGAAAAAAGASFEEYGLATGGVGGSAPSSRPPSYRGGGSGTVSAASSGNSSANNSGKFFYDANAGNGADSYRQRNYSKDYDQQFPTTRNTPPINSSGVGQQQISSSRSFDNRATSLTTPDSYQQQYLMMYDQKSTPPAAGTSLSYSFQSTPPFALKQALQVCLHWLVVISFHNLQQ